MSTPRLAELAAAIGRVSGQPFVCARQETQGGGCINQGIVLIGHDGRRFFAKLNAADKLDMFEAEADGLRALAASEAIRVPRPLIYGRAGDAAYLILEWLPLEGRASPEAMGRRLAQLHGQSQAEFGWWRDNYIGATPQENAPLSNWIEFYRERRLRPQIERARAHAAPRRLLQQGERLLTCLEDFFPAYQPVPSLLHGDLWGGNHGYVDGEPVIFDPAVYFGDREADLAMTELFGGYPASFYAAYREAWPLDPGYRVRKALYNLYHVLNHFNLFGGGYAAQAEAMLGRLLAESSAL